MNETGTDLKDMEQENLEINIWANTRKWILVYKNELGNLYKM